MKERKPNFLFVLADDMGAWAMRCAGNNDVITDNLDDLAENGMLFENFFCVSPVCSPARASILSGRIPSSHGVHDWIRSGNLEADGLGVNRDDAYYRDERKAIGYMDGIPCYTDILAENGYSCALSGKWHLGDSIRPQHGFSSWFTIGRGGCQYYRPDIIENGRLSIRKEYVTGLITEKALEFLDGFAGSSNPFYLSVHYTAPHSPWDKDQHPERIYDLYDGCDFTSTPDLPLNRNQVKSAPYGVGKRRKELLRGYYSAITAMDEGIGKILTKLEENGQIDDTIVIFSSDNGMNMGHHGIWGKGNGTFPLNMYDTSVKVPMIISWRNHIQAGKSNSMLSHYDLFPTILELAGVTEHPFMDKLPGRSFFPLLAGECLDSDDDIFVHDEYGTTRMIRTKNAKLVYRYPYGPHELYDLENDPGEDCNLYDDPGWEMVRCDLMKRLEEWFLRYSDPRVDGTKEAVTGFGQLDRPGVFRSGKNTFEPIQDELFV